MINSLYLAYHYLWYHKLRNFILTVSLAIIIFMPFGLQKLISESEKRMMDRATSTPLIIGEKGSATDLVINSLYFEKERTNPLTVEMMNGANDLGFGYCIPVHGGFEARGFPIVGTTTDYLDFRNLSIAEGRRMTHLGECVLGAKVAEKLGLKPDDHIISSPETYFNLAGVYPLKMKITGVLGTSNTPDDNAIFVDIKTLWIILGIGHGHQDLEEVADDPTLVMKNEEGELQGTAKVMMYNEITEKNKDSFHFHGDQDKFPVGTLIFVPESEKALTLLRGRFETEGLVNQAVVPKQVIQKLLDNIFRIQKIFNSVFIAVGVATLFIFMLIMALTIRLRQDELRTFEIIGSSRTKVFEILALEIIILILSSGILASVLYLITGNYVDRFIERFII